MKADCATVRQNSRNTQCLAKPYMHDTLTHDKLTWLCLHLAKRTGQARSAHCNIGDAVSWSNVTDCLHRVSAPFVAKRSYNRKHLNRAKLIATSPP